MNTRVLAKRYKSRIMVTVLITAARPVWRKMLCFTVTTSIPCSEYEGVEIKAFGCYQCNSLDKREAQTNIFCKY